VTPAWRIFYDDGSTFSSADGEPHEAPSEGVICAVGYTPDDGERYIANRGDYYHFHRGEGRWWECDLAGLLDRLRNNSEVYAYKEGRRVSKKLWEEILIAANNDPDFPQR